MKKITTSLISVGGYAYSGKDAFADIFVEEFGYIKDYFSRPLEEALLILNPRIVLRPEDIGLLNAIYAPLLNYNLVHSLCYKSIHGLLGYNESKKILEVRRLLQILGTEIGRDMFHENCWSDYMERTIVKSKETNNKLVITGTRYKNEMDMVHRNGGLLIWVDRGGKPVNSHSSDNTLCPENFDLIINNKGTLEDLRRWVIENFV